MRGITEVERHQIATGMRWTVWLAAIALPMNVATSMLVARISPEAIGVYALLTVYGAIITAVCYFGGDTVVIRFTPLVDAELRFSFLASYYLLTCLTVLCVLAISAVHPGWLAYIFIEQVTPRWKLILLALAPFPIALSMLTACLKGLLEIRAAQLITRMLTVGAFAFYLGAYVAGQAWLSRSYHIVIWAVYLSLTMVAAIAALSVLLRLTPRQPTRLRLYFPAGFWRFAAHTQLVALVWFLLQRLDVLLIGNLGGLHLLGTYAAAAAIANIVLTINTFFTDPLLPCLSWYVGKQDLPSAESVFRTHARIAILSTTAVTCALLSFRTPLLLALGPAYSQLDALVTLTVALNGISAPGVLGAAVLSATGNQSRAVWLGMAQVVLFALLFWCVWPAFKLLGAGFAMGAAAIFASGAQLYLAGCSFPVQGAVRPYVCSAVAIAAVALTSVATNHLPLLLLLAGAWFIGFTFAAGYSLREFVKFASVFLPFRALRHSLT